MSTTGQFQCVRRAQYKFNRECALHDIRISSMIQGTVKIKGFWLPEKQERLCGISGRLDLTVFGQMCHKG